MKVLFVTLCALEVNTSVTKSNVGLLKGLKSLGADITIIMPNISKDVYYYDKSFDLDGIRVIRLNSCGIGQKVANMQGSKSKIKSYLFNKLRNLYNNMSVYGRSTSYLKEVDTVPIYDEFFDYVISTSDPKSSHLFVGGLVKNGLKYGKWIQHWGDPLMGDVSRRTVHPEWYIKYMEKKTIKNADRIIYVSPFTAEKQKNNHPGLQNKIGFAPLICDEITPEENKDIFNEKGKLKVAFIGDYNSQTRDIMPLYNACKKLSFVYLVIAGNTDLRLESAENMNINKRVPQAKARELEMDADVIVSVGNRFGTQIPGKIYYLSSSKKIILITMEEDNKEAMRSYFQSFNRFETCDNTEESIIIALKRLYEAGRPLYKTPERLMPIGVIKQILS